MISIVIPVYNVKEYLNVCVSSIVDQPYSDWECILVDDGSSDGSGELCDQWDRKDIRIRVIHQPNRGVSFARNRGIKEAKGEYIYFIDADDWCEGCIFNINTKHDLIIGSYYTVETSGNKILHQHKDIISPNAALAFLKEEIRCRMGGFIVKKAILYEYNIYFKNGFKYGEDLDFILRIIMSSGNILIVHTPFVNYRITNTSSMSKFSFDRYSVFFSRLELAKYAELQGDKDVCDYLENFSCPESAILTTRDLLRTQHSAKSVKMFIRKHGNLYRVLKKASISQSLPKHFRYSAWLIIHNIFIYMMFIRFLYQYYWVRERLGLFKRNVLR